jgi:hypothetical protein
MDDWATAMGSGHRGGKGEVCLVGDPVGVLVGGLVGGQLGGLVGGMVGALVGALVGGLVVVFDKSFWCGLAFVTPAQATSYICACAENMGDCLSPYSQEILHIGIDIQMGQRMDR